MTPFEIIRNTALGAAGLFVVGFGIGTIEMLPDDTPVTFNSSQGLYVTLDCLRAGIAEKGGGAYLLLPDELDQDSPYITTLGKVREDQTLRPDPICRDAGGFEGRKGSVSGDLLRSLFGSE